jgi:hypothetical protein
MIISTNCAVFFFEFFTFDESRPLYSVIDTDVRSKRRF